MRLRETYYAAASSYLQTGSLAVVMLLQMQLALHALTKEQFGLWSFTQQSLGYLLLMDFGVAGSVSRLMTDPLHRGQEKDWNGWFNLIFLILVGQGVAVLVAGWWLVDPIIAWFKIPSALHAEARQLWLLMLVLNAVMLPLRVFLGILAAQNRFYLATLSSMAGTWAGLGVFYYALHRGHGTIAYGYASILSMAVSGLAPALAVWRGRQRFWFSLRNIPWEHTRELFGFSSAIFIIGIAGQIVFMSQSLIITRFCGLAAVAAFTVCSRLPMMVMQLIWRPFDAFAPRWQIFWCQEQTEQLRKEVREGLRLTIGLSLLVVTCCLAGNRWFVHLVGGADLYAGRWFDLLLGLFVLTQVWNHCLACLFFLGKEMRLFALLVGVDAALTLAVGVLAARWFGMMGYMASMGLWFVVSVIGWYLTWRGPGILKMRRSELYGPSLRFWAPAAILLGGGAAVLVALGRAGTGLTLGCEAGLLLAALGLFVWLYRRDLGGYTERLKNAWQSRRAVVPPQTGAGT